MHPFQWILLTNLLFAYFLHQFIWFLLNILSNTLFCVTGLSVDIDPAHLGCDAVRVLEQATQFGPDLNSSDFKQVYQKIWGVVYQQFCRSRVHKIDEVKQYLLNIWLRMDHHITTMQLMRGVGILEHACGQM